MQHIEYVKNVVVKYLETNDPSVLQGANPATDKYGGGGARGGGGRRDDGIRRANLLEFPSNLLSSIPPSLPPSLSPSI